jgi:hypothetical protein
MIENVFDLIIISIAKLSKFVTAHIPELDIIRPAE